MHYSKRRALFASIACAVAAYGFYTYQQQYTAMWICVVCSVAFFGIWLDKVIRDLNIVSEANKETAKGVQTNVVPPMCNKDSRRLFVPEPLND
jgi:hypothetical protein